MIIFNGFPAIKNIDDVDVDIELTLMDGISNIYNKKMKTSDDEELFFKEITKIDTLINIIMNKETDERTFILSNFIDMLIWFNETTDYHFFNKEKTKNMIDKYMKIMNYTDLYHFLFNYYDKYDYCKKIFENIDFTKIDNGIYYINEFCKKTNRDYKTVILNYADKKIHNEKVMKLIKDNFDLFDENDLNYITSGMINKDEIDKSLQKINIIKQISEELI